MKTRGRSGLIFLVVVVIIGILLTTACGPEAVTVSVANESTNTNITIGGKLVGPGQSADVQTHSDAKVSIEWINPNVAAPPGSGEIVVVSLSEKNENKLEPIAKPNLTHIR